jgi:hypothetical protein
MLGLSYYLGRGVKQDYAESVRWYRKAADAGNASGQYNLGLAYANGEGVPQNYVIAHMWLNLSSSNSTGLGDEKDERAKVRDEIAWKMTTQQIAEAQRLAAEWKPKR